MRWYDEETVYIICIYIEINCLVQIELYGWFFADGHKLSNAN